MTLQDEIAEALREKRQEFKRIENLGLDRDMLLAQAAIDVVERRLLSEASIATCVHAVDRTDNLECGLNAAWQAVKAGDV